MAQQNPSTPSSNQISTSDVDPAASAQAAPPPAIPPTPDPEAAQGPETPTGDDAPANEAPKTSAEVGELLHPQVDTKEGVGVDGETIVWEARYSMKNFLGRLTGGTLLLIAWIALLIYAWSLDESEGWMFLAIVTGIAGGVYWLNLIYRIIMARYSHFYRLTTRRLFVSTGLFNRRRDMTELLKVEDVYTKQTLIQRWLSLGTVVVVSSDQKFPTVLLPGVDDPKEVMDTIWHFARAERDHKSVRIDSL